jgi:hypothetical protein
MQTKTLELRRMANGIHTTTVGFIADRKKEMGLARRELTREIRVGDAARQFVQPCHTLCRPSAHMSNAVIYEPENREDRAKRGVAVTRGLI